jgi:hypothetical protein
MGGGNTLSYSGVSVCMAKKGGGIIKKVVHLICIACMVIRISNKNPKQQYRERKVNQRFD